MHRLVGFSLFPIRKLIHGAQIRPYYLCKELGIPLYFQAYPHVPAEALIRAILDKATILVFIGYTADQTDLLLLYLAKLRGCRIILDVADIPYLQYFFFNGKPSAKSQLDWARLLEIADIVLFATSSFERITRETVDLEDKDCYLLENASDPNHFRFSELPEEKSIGYVGGYIPARGVGDLVEAFKIVRRGIDDCTLRLVSEGYPENNPEQGLQIWRSVFYEEIPSLFKSSRVFAIPHRVNLYMRAAAPLKLFDAMACGRPVVCTPCDETVSVIERHGCGIVTGYEPSSMAKSIAYLMEHKNMASEMGRRGRLAVEKRYSWKVRGQELREILNQ